MCYIVVAFSFLGLGQVSLDVFEYLVLCKWYFYYIRYVKFKFNGMFSVILYLLFILLQIYVFLDDATFNISDAWTGVISFLDLVNLIKRVLGKLCFVNLFFISVGVASVGSFWSKWAVMLSVYFLVICF